MELLGRLAEEYVIEFEKIRLPIKGDDIKSVSDIDVTAGYDIISFESDSSKEYDRYIEVKSYNDVVGFFWSKNEVEISRQKGKKYYLYLVDRSKMRDKKYMPIIVNDPYNNIYCNPNEWEKTCTDWYIVKMQSV